MPENGELAFQHNFLTNEGTPSPSYNDFALAELLSEGGTKMSRRFTQTIAPYSAQILIIKKE